MRESLFGVKTINYLFIHQPPIIAKIKKDSQGKIRNKMAA